MMKNRLVWRNLFREFRVLELRVVMAILLITTIFLFVISMGLKNISFQLTKNAEYLLGAKLIIESANPVPDQLTQQAQTLSLQTTKNIGFFTMASKGEDILLVQIETFEGDFPLSGKLKVRMTGGEMVSSLPSLGDVFVSKAFLDRLQVEIGETFQVADQTFVMAGELIDFPFMLSRMGSFSPVIYMHKSDVDKLDVIQPGSRVNYRLIVQGDPKDIAAFRRLPEVSSGQYRITSVFSGRESIARPIEIIERYLSIIIILQCILTSIVIGFSVMEYAKKQVKTVAILRTIGASFQTVLSKYLVIMGVIALITLFCGSIIGYGILHTLFAQIKPFAIERIDWNWTSFVFTMGLSVCLVFSFSLPALLSLRQVSASRMIRSQQPFKTKYNILYVFALLFLVGIICLYTEEFNTPFRFLAMFIVLACIGLGIAHTLWWVFARFNKFKNHVIRFAISALHRQQWEGIIQFIVFTMLFTILLVVEILQWDMLPSWRAQLPSDTPNYFLVNVQPYEEPMIQEWFAENQLDRVDFYPMIRGHFTQVNGQYVSTWGKGRQDPTAPKGLRRPINLTYAEKLPQNNQHLAGQQWETVDQQKHFVSIEASFAAGRNIKVGDSLTFEIENQSVTATVAQIRTVNWQSFTPNFYVVFTRSALASFPSALIGSFYMPKEQSNKIGDFYQTFPQVSIIDMDAIQGQVKEWVFKVSRILQIVLMVMLLGGLLLMIIMLNATIKARIRESALLKCFGAPTGFIQKAAFVEFLIFGGICGVVAGVFAQLIVSDIAYDYFNIHYRFKAKWLLLGFMSSSVIVLFGLLALKKVIKTPPVQILRGI